MNLTTDELVVIVEGMREYRLRADLPRRVIIDPLIIKLISELGGSSAADESETTG